METDKTPLEYLKQRVKYYDVKIKYADKMIEDHNMVKRYGVDKLMDISLHYHKRWKQFNDAVTLIAGMDLVNAINKKP